MEVNCLDLVGEGYTGSMQWQLGREMGTIPAFASKTQENQGHKIPNGCNDFVEKSDMISNAYINRTFPVITTSHFHNTYSTPN